MGAKRLMQYQQEFLATAYDDIQELLQLHWQEIALNKDVIKLNPDWEQYEAAEKAGALRGFTARENGKLVGYFVVLVSRSMHYKDHLFATNDVIFLHPDHRKGFAGVRLIKFAADCLRSDGVSMLFINTKVHRPFGTVLKRLGFNHVESVFSKRLI